MEPVPRGPVFDRYWWLAAERQAVFMRRVAGEPAPWTRDPTLAVFKFCNTFRAADRESQYLIRQLYAEPSASKADLVFRAAALRTFSRSATWERLKAILGHQPGIRDLQDGSFGRAVETLAGILELRKERMYTSAFILCANDAYGQGNGAKKRRTHVLLWEDMFVKHELGDRVASARSLQDVYWLLYQFPLMGEFMSYQTAIDINYSTATDFSENDFTKPGPGAVRGLRKVFTHLGDLKPEEVVMWMVERQASEFERLGYEFKGLWGRPLHAIDCQGLFCETDKYCREAFPDLQSNRSKIKQRFTVTHEPVTLFFPPKWGINDRLPRAPVLGVRDGQTKLAT